MSQVENSMRSILQPLSSSIILSDVGIIYALKPHTYDESFSFATANICSEEK